MKWTVAFAACLAFVSAQNTLPDSFRQNTTDHSETTPTPSPKTTTTVPPAHNEATVNTYNVTVPGTNHTCILIKAAIQIKVAYITTDDQVKEAIMALDNTTVVDPVRSTCSSPLGEQFLVLRFGHNNSLSLIFTKNGTVYLHSVAVDYTVSSALFPHAAKLGEHVTVTNNTLMLYSVPEDRSYHCNVDQPVYVGANVTLDVISVQLQAFRNTTSETGQFGDAVECSAGDISNIVPIAVGSALAALVIIVLIAYLIGRSKSRQKGYQSV